VTSEKKLRLVSPAPRTIDDAEAAPTEEELREAAKLREALERGSDEASGALRAAWDPEALDAADHDAILARALGDEGKATANERREADALRASLEASDESHEGVLLAAALRSAHAPSPIEPSKNELLVTAALAKAGEAKPTGKPRARVVAITMVAMTAVAAMAAGVALVFPHASDTTAGAPLAAAQVAASHEPIKMIAARSSQDLFDADKPFPKEGGESARVDRIAAARASDLRENRFNAWGVR